MDVLQLIDKLEQLVNSGTRLPLSSRTVIDEQEFLDIIDQLRIMVPDEIKQARRVSSERTGSCTTPRRPPKRSSAKPRSGFAKCSRTARLPAWPS